MHRWHAGNRGPAAAPQPPSLLLVGSPSCLRVTAAVAAPSGGAHTWLMAEAATRGLVSRTRRVAGAVTAWLRPPSKASARCRRCLQMRR